MLTCVLPDVVRSFQLGQFLVAVSDHPRGILQALHRSIQLSLLQLVRVVLCQLGPLVSPSGFVFLVGLRRMVRGIPGAFLLPYHCESHVLHLHDHYLAGLGFDLLHPNVVSAYALDFRVGDGGGTWSGVLCLFVCVRML